jgi:dolichyl-phosphate-mannose-protein mannosyltransferase
VTILRQPGIDGLLEQGPPSTWAVLDMALSRQSGAAAKDWERDLARWVVVHEFPSSLNLPTLLDVDPSAAGRATSDRAANLDLLRQRGAGDVR